ncbi:DUF4386 domain-containing protein [Paenibacillus sp. 1P07SE]|uniref:DUF4386 domain-containing protein n=1 Tax=Paenibacillus sp. 1P07SE TaxID=3132209 RepID=UPI0039A47050
MKTYRMTAAIVGILYIIGTISGILSLVVTRDLLVGDDYLTRIAADPLRLKLGAFFIVTMGLSLAAMPVFLYPLFKHKNEALAMGMVVFRGPLEGSTYILVAVSWLLLDAVGQSFTAAQADAASIQVVGNVLLQSQDIIAPVLTIVFIIGAMLLYILFYLTRLIPRWLSVGGMIGGVIYLVVDLCLLFGLDLHLDVLYVPLALQEITMALWLLIRGFDQAYLGELRAERE